MTISLYAESHDQNGNGADETCTQLKNKQRFTVNLPSDLIERIRDTVYWTPGLTVAQLLSDAARDTLDRMEAANRLPFPRRNGKLKVGRPRLFRDRMKRSKTVRTDDTDSRVNGMHPH